MSRIIINQDLWARREVYNFFSECSEPFYELTFKQDVTNLLNFTRKHKLSFYYTMMWACMKAINNTEAFMYEIQDGDVYKISYRDPSFADAKEDDENDLFYIVNTLYDEDVVKFVNDAKAASDAQDFFIDKEFKRQDLVYFSCLPKVELTSLTNSRNFSKVDSIDESAPHIAWGKYIEEDGRATIGVSIEVNHRLIDFIHLGQFVEKLTEVINSLE